MPLCAEKSPNMKKKCTEIEIPKYAVKYSNLSSEKKILSKFHLRINNLRIPWTSQNSRKCFAKKCQNFIKIRSNQNFVNFFQSKKFPKNFIKNRYFMNKSPKMPKHANIQNLR